MKKLLLDRSKQSDGFHLSGTVTVTYHHDYYSNGQYRDFYGFSMGQEETASVDITMATTPFGATTVPLLSALFSDWCNYNSYKDTTVRLNALKDLTPYENKTMTVTRLDTGLSFKALITYEVITGEYAKEGWRYALQDVDVNNFLFFTSSDNGKIISITIDIQ